MPTTLSRAASALILNSAESVQALPGGGRPDIASYRADHIGVIFVATVDAQD